MADPAQVSDPHQPGDALTPAPQAESETELGVDPRRAIGAARVAVDLRDRRDQLLVRDLAGRRRAAAPLVVAGPRHLKDPAGHRDGNPVGGELEDQPEPYFGSTFSRAK